MRPGGRGRPCDWGRAVIELGWRPPVPSVSVGHASTTEGDSGQGTLEFTLTLSAPSDEPVTIDYATDDGTAESSPPTP